MAYNIPLPRNQMRDLYLLREFAAQGSIIGQVRRAISSYLKSQEKRIGCSIADLAEATERYERKCNQSQFEALPQMERQD